MRKSGRGYYPPGRYQKHGNALARHKVESKTFLELRASLDLNWSVEDIRANTHRDLREHFERRFDMYSAAFARLIQSIHGY